MASSPHEPLSVSYSTSSWAFWRGTAKMMVLPRVLRWFLLIGFVVSPLIYFSLDKWFVPFAAKLLAAYLGGFTAFWLNILFAVTIVAWVAPFKLKTIMTTCDEGALREQSATYNKTMPWQKIESVFLWNGDIYFLSRSGLEGLFIPREAFSSRQEANEFCEKARLIRQGALAK